MTDSCLDQISKLHKREEARVTTRLLRNFQVDLKIFSRMKFHTKYSHANASRYKSFFPHRNLFK